MKKIICFIHAYSEECSSAVVQVSYKLVATPQMYLLHKRKEIIWVRY